MKIRWKVAHLLQQNKPLISEDEFAPWIVVSWYLHIQWVCLAMRLGAS